VTPDVLKLFISAIEGESIDLTNDNIEGLSALSDEFGFKSLSTRVNQWNNSFDSRLSRLEDSFARLKAELQVLQSPQQPTTPQTDQPATPKLESAIISEFPDLFSEFHSQQFSLLWRGSRDGFGISEFHSRCDGHSNTLTVILDTEGNIFGGFTPLEWASAGGWKTDESLRSFLFTLQNPHKFPARKVALKAEKNRMAILCRSDYGPCFRDIVVYDDCKSNTDSYTEVGQSYTNDTGITGTTFFTGANKFQAKEIEVFEIIA
jgi:hypothetical protein